MRKLDKNTILLLVNEASSRTARIQTFAAKMDTAVPEHPLDGYRADLLSAHLEIVIDHLRTVREMASYLSRPVKGTSRLWKNGSGQYETTAGSCFREGSPKSLCRTSTVWTVPIYCGSEAEQYSFYRIPKALLTAPR